MPFIGIAKCSKLDDYRHAITSAGGPGDPEGAIRILEATMTVAAALDGIHGVLLTGGDDVAPARYSESAGPTVVQVDAERDEFEIGLVVEARRRRLPILGICRGAQVLNVACGGSLVQDIPSQVPGAIEHRFKVPDHPAFFLAHELWLEKDTLLERLMRERLSDADACEVNSRHHQAVKQVAAGFLVSATAPDGVVEAIEDPSASFCLGVQWHPENFWRTGEFRPLFEGFLEATVRALSRP